MVKPTASDVAKRLIILKYQVVHSMALPPDEVLQKLFQQWSIEEQRKFSNFKNRSDELIASMKSNGLWSCMTKEEKEFLGSVPPKVKKQQHLNAMWRLESVIVLMWSLGLVKDFPPFDTQSDPEILKQIPYLDIDKFFSSAALLPDNEIERMRSLAELWHWRSRTRQLIESKTRPQEILGVASFDQIVENVAQEADKRGDLAQVIERDFVAKGKAYRELSHEDWSEVFSITIERHHALNWICGYAARNAWDKTPTDT
jgi:hypothetical protein